MEERLTPSVQIRVAVPADADAIAAVLYESFKEFEPLYTRGGFEATTPSADLIRARWSEGPVWIAACDGVVAGTVSAVIRERSLYVRSMAVLPSARGRNIGRLLLEKVDAHALEHGCGRLFLSTTPFLLRAITLYERCGFRRTDEGPDNLSGTPLLTMEKILRRS
jgi:GNAT superfamily N-acetyltransferase